MVQDRQPKVISGEKARQGRKGARILWILAISLVLALIVWFAAGTWGTSTAPDPAQQPQSGATTQEPASSQP